MCVQRGLIAVRLNRDIYQDIIDPRDEDGKEKEGLGSLISDLEFRRSRIQTFSGDTKKIEKAITGLRTVYDMAERRFKQAKRVIKDPALMAIGLMNWPIK